MSRIPSQPQYSQQPLAYQGQPVQYPAAAGQPVAQPVAVQPVVVQQVKPPATAEAASAAHEEAWRDVTVRIYDHSPLIYWWPVWVLGYVMALITYMNGTTVRFADTGFEVYVHPSKNLGVIFMVVTFLVIVMTNATVRGLASALVLMTLLAATLLFAYMGWWDEIMSWVGMLAIYMNMGFYMFFSTVILIAWLLAVFVFDRTDWWNFRAGQAEHVMLVGGQSRSFDTHGMSVFKLRDDLFRHWLLGLGSGDLHIATTGAKREEFVLKNVFFINRKLEKILHLVSLKPDSDEPAPTG